MHHYLLLAILPLFKHRSYGMAEFLIYKKYNWMDKVDSRQWAELRKNPQWDEKYLDRYQRFDIVEVRPDGFFTGRKARGFNQEAFRLLIVPGLKADNRYMKSSHSNKRRYRINLPGDKSIVTVSVDKFTPEDKDA